MIGIDEPVSALNQLLAMMRDLGATRFFAKRLAPNDNSKNQVYLGPDFSALNVLPTGTLKASTDSDTVKAPLKWAWVDQHGSLYMAPNAQLILYPQYPEVRFSGFLLGCPGAPRGIMASRKAGRVLLFGIRNDGTVLGYAADGGTAVAHALYDRGEPSDGVFVRVHVQERDTSRDDLLTALRGVHLSGWLPGCRLRSDGTQVPCAELNCGGYTLEAALGIAANGTAAPDYRGWEVKQYSVGDIRQPVAHHVVTLMTPEPTGGDYRELGVEGFVRKYGYPDQRGRSDRLNFGGIFRAGVRAPRTGLTLVMPGFDTSTGKLMVPSGQMQLVTDDGGVAASWSYTDLVTHWSYKHARAAYIPSERRDHPERAYRYGAQILLGEGTDALRFLNGLAKGDVYLDPLTKLENASTSKPKIHRRNQFRVAFAALGFLYKTWERVPLL